MKKLFDALRDALQRGEDAVLVTIVASSGSAPRGTGARMLVTAAGRVCGTIGGGAVEYKGEQIAQDILRTKRSRQENFRLYKNDVADLGMVCGGTVDVYFRFIPAGDADVLRLIDQCAGIFDALEPAWLISELTEGGLSVYSEKRGVLGDAVPPEVIAALGVRPAQVEAGEKVYYCEKLLQPGRVYIFGGGHVARALAPALIAADFACVVLDDRPDFLDPADFGGARTRRIDPADISDVLRDLTENDYVCIMTRGHKDDMDIQRQVMRSPVRYIGVIGSARKQRTVKERILAMGYDEAEFDKVVSPIGLDIGAETPAELAVSITAQLIMVRAGKGTGPRDWKS
ncbi:MAG: XdhC family protein [Ruminococcaceae bacterium]|nr:XdhC family protein [Oscillospiraceae bacterium]